MRFLALCAVGLWACGASAAELPSRAQKTKAPEAKTHDCFIGDERGVELPGGSGCVRVGGYVSVGVTGGNIKH